MGAGDRDSGLEIEVKERRKRIMPGLIGMLIGGLMAVGASIGGYIELNSNPEAENYNEINSKYAQLMALGMITAGISQGYVLKKMNP